MPQNHRNSLFLKSLKNLRTKGEHPPFEYTKTMKHSFRGEEINIKSLLETKEEYLQVLKHIKGQQKEMHNGFKKVEEQIKELSGISEKTKLNEYNENQRRALVKTKSDVAEIQIIEEELKVLQLIVTKTRDLVLTEKYLDIVDLITQKAKTYLKTTEGTHPKTRLFVSSTLVEITKILETTAPQNMEDTLNKIYFIVVNDWKHN